MTENVTLIWCFCAALAIVLAALCGFAWVIDRRDRASLMLCILGFATAVAAYCELCMMHSRTTAEYGEWLRWYHIPVGSALVAMLLFVYFYLGSGRVWLLWTIIVARVVILLVNFSVEPNFNFSNIASLRQIRVFGEQISAIGVATPREWVWFANASWILVVAYLVDAIVQRRRKGGNDSQRKVVAAGVGIVFPLFSTIVYTQSIVVGVLSAPVSCLPWFLGALVMMAAELGRDFVVSRRARLEVAELRSTLAQVERVSLMAQLASSLSHELSQPLTATVTNVKAGLRHLEAEKPDLEELRAILNDIGSDHGRSAKILEGMRRLFKHRRVEMQLLSVEQLVRDVVSLVGPEMKNRNVVLRVNIPAGLPLMAGDPVQLTQVLLNLLMNSLHALASSPSGERRIDVEARADRASQEVEIAVQDSGPGIPAGDAGQLFEPFYTTKPEGTGIGLALARTIIEAHGGRLWCDAGREGGGAVFRFTLRQGEPQPASLPFEQARPIAKEIGDQGTSPASA